MKLLTLLALLALPSAVAIAQPAVGDVSTPSGVTDKVQLVSPADGAVVYEGTLRLVWRAIPFGTQYEIELSTDNFATVGGMLGSFDTTLSIPILAENQRYWWRVRGMGFEGWGPYSDARSFDYRSFASVRAEGDAASISHLRASPNPAVDGTIIRFHLDRGEVVTLDVIDRLGRRMMTRAERYDAGDRAIEIDLSGMSSGCHLYWLSTPRSVSVGTLIVNR